MMDKIILNKTRKTNDRYTLLNLGMGGAGDPYYYPTHSHCVAQGMDRGNGYQGYMSITFFLNDESHPIEVKEKLISILKTCNYTEYLKEEGHEF